MTGILADIIAHKRTELEDSRSRMSLAKLWLRCADMPPVRDFIGALANKGCSLIAEVKTASPSKGVIRNNIDPLEVASIYEAHGASCVSVLTDERFFGGSIERLRKIRAICSLPLLRKDFIIDSYQLFEARAAGADAVLLIAACLDDNRMGELMACTRNLGMAALVEVHDAEELDRAASLGAKLIGINNRDLVTFKTDIALTEMLASSAPDNAILVSESGIFTAEDVRKVYYAGVDAVLVGEAIMRSDDISHKVSELACAVTG